MNTQSVHSIHQASARYLSFDLARGLAVLFMVMVHVSDFYGSPSYQSSNLSAIFTFLGEAPAAPVFMLIMGVFLAIVPKGSLSTGLKRAAMLIAFGYLLNFFRASVPMWIGLQLGILNQEELGDYTPLTEFLIVDILHFAGLAYGICVLLRHYLDNTLIWVALAVIVALGSPLLWGIESGNGALDILLALLWGGDEQNSTFPLLPWLTFPLLGMAFGKFFTESDNKGVFYRKSLFTGLVLIVVGNLINFAFPDFRTDDYALLEPGNVIWMTGLVLSWLWACNLIVEKVPTNKVFNLLFFWSKHVTNFYVIQWMFICWGQAIVGYQQMDATGVVVSIFVITLLSDIITRLWIRIRKNDKTPKTAQVTSA